MVIPSDAVVARDRRHRLSRRPWSGCFHVRRPCRRQAVRSPRSAESRATRSGPSSACSGWAILGSYVLIDRIRVDQAGRDGGCRPFADAARRHHRGGTDGRRAPQLNQSDIRRVLDCAVWGGALYGVVSLRCSFGSVSTLRRICASCRGSRSTSISKEIELLREGMNRVFRNIRLSNTSSESWRGCCCCRSRSTLRIPSTDRAGVAAVGAGGADRARDPGIGVALGDPLGRLGARVCSWC